MSYFELFKLEGKTQKEIADWSRKYARDAHSAQKSFKESCSSASGCNPAALQFTSPLLLLLDITPPPLQKYFSSGHIYSTWS
jgi:hypothetical protein